MACFEVQMPDGSIVPCSPIDAPMAHHKLGLSWTRSGYGKKIPTAYKVHVHGRDRRVYVMIWANSGTCYVIVDGQICPC